MLTKQFTASPSGVARFEKLFEELSAISGFWDAVHIVLDKIGLTPEWVTHVRPVLARDKRNTIKDNIWGMMEFSADEIALINNPLLQRLRWIKQLGFTYLTYPSAEHSRFSHTLGVCHTVKRLLQSIDDLARRDRVFRTAGGSYEYYSTTTDLELRRSLIHAALLHDIGHPAFSHAGERALVAFGDKVVFGPINLDNLVQRFRNNDIPSDLSECLSLVYCLCPRFQDYYARAMGPTADQGRVFEVCSFIAGIPHDPVFPGLANLISGAAVDGDKIDYVQRDAAGCGIPVGVDVSRIFLNTALVRLTREQAAEIARGTRGDLRTAKIGEGVHFIINSTGIDTYEEIALSKSALHHRVYRHQLTRNVEELLVACVGRLAFGKRKAPDITAFLGFSDQQLLAHFSSTAATRTLALRIEKRELPKRALVLVRDSFEPYFRFAETFDSEEWRVLSEAIAPSELDNQLFRATSGRAWRELGLIDLISAREQSRQILAAVRENAVGVRELLDDDFSADALTGDEPLVGFSQRVGLKPTPEVLIRQKNSIRYSHDWTKTEELTSAENVGKIADYVYADADWCRYVRLAALKVYYEKAKGMAETQIDDLGKFKESAAHTGLGVRFSPDIDIREICSRIGVDYNSTMKDLHSITTKGFFGEDHRIVPLSSDQTRACGSIAEEKFVRRFLGERGWTVTARSLCYFVRQFPIDLRDEMIKLLAQAEILGRGAIYSGLMAAVEKILTEGIEKLIICRFSPKSGSWTHSLFQADTYSRLSSQGHVFISTVSEIEREFVSAQDAGKRAALLLVDDQFGSGGQACAQLLYWSGKNRADWPEELRTEQNIDLTPLNSGSVAVLKSKQVVLGFVYGTEQGKSRIEDQARAEGFRELTVLYGGVLPSKVPNMSGPMKAFLELVGINCLNHCRYGGAPLTPETSASLKRDALGYAGTASIVATPINVPSHAITALWCPGFVAELPWTPLFIRRGYLQHLLIG